jgi:hypothetical protein
MEAISDKQHAHELIERLPASDVITVVRFLEFMLLDPVARAIANAPLDDEPVTDEDCKTIAAARDPSTKFTPHEEFLAELGITQEEIENYREPA